jgi:hypothetical protein
MKTGVDAAVVSLDLFKLATAESEIRTGYFNDDQCIFEHLVQICGIYQGCGRSHTVNLELRVGRPSTIDYTNLGQVDFWITYLLAKREIQPKAAEAMANATKRDCTG